MSTPVPFLIGPSRDLLTGAYTDREAVSVVVPRPFDIRHQWRQDTGRDIGGLMTRGTFEGMDWVYGATSNAVVEAFGDIYNPSYPFVWVHFLDSYTGTGWWYEGVMLPPHIERGAGMTITSFIVPFRRLVRQET
jgi:hypothetical protein